MQNLKIYLIIGGLLLLVVSLFSYLFSGSIEIIERFEGPIPFIPTAGINKTVRHYIETKPSRFVLLIGGPSQSGKSRLIDMLHQESIDNSRLSIRIDAGQANSIEDLMDFVKVGLVEGLAPIQTSINFKNVENFDMTETSTRKEKMNTEQKMTKLYKALVKSIDSCYKNGFSERNIHRFFEILEIVSDNFHPIIFVHNYDRISLLGTNDDPEFGKKLIDSIIAYLKHRDLYSQTIPIVLEIKNTLYLLQKNPNPIFRYYEMEQLGDVTKDLVDNTPVFNLFELKSVIKSFGPHGGSIAKIFESLRYGMKIDNAIESLSKSIRKGLRAKISGNEHAIQLSKRICDGKGSMHVTNISDIKTLAPLFNGYLYLSKDFQIKSSNKAVVRVLCSINSKNLDDF